MCVCCVPTFDSPPRLLRRVGEDLFVFEVAPELHKCISRYSCFNRKYKLQLQLSTHNAASGAPLQASPSAKCVANNNHNNNWATLSLGPD